MCCAETSDEDVSMQGAARSAATDDTASMQPGRMYKYRRWLGHWKPEYNHIRTETELALYVSFFAYRASRHVPQGSSTVYHNGVQPLL